MTYNDRSDLLRLDYEHTIQYHHHLSDIRFRLLAFVPIATGGAIVLVEESLTGPAVLAIGLLGFLVTLGITIYDQRNTQIYDAMQKRAKMLEGLMGFPPLNAEAKRCGGAFLDRPDRGRRLLGLILMWHDRGLAIIYSAVFAGWAYLMTKGLTETLPMTPRTVGWTLVLVPSSVFCLFVVALERFDDPTDVPEALPAEIRARVFIEADEALSAAPKEEQQ